MTVQHGDFVQFVSVTSKVNDGVLVVEQNGGLSASGTIYPYGAPDSGADAAYFHCHAMGPASESLQAFLLLPVSKTAEGAFLCPVMEVASVPHPRVRVLAVDATAATSADGAVCDVTPALTLKDVDPFAESTEYATDCRWYVVPASGSQASPAQRVYVALDGGKKVYAAATSSGQAFATVDDRRPDWPSDSLYNPQTYFYLYRKYYLPECSSIAPLWTPSCCLGGCATTETAEPRLRPGYGGATGSDSERSSL